MRIKNGLIILNILAVAYLSLFGASDILGDFSELTEIKCGFQFTEGGARDAEGNLYFTDIPNNRIHKWNPQDNQVTTFASDSNGANGCWMDGKGRLIVCEGKGRAIVEYDKKGKRTVIFDSIEGNKFNSPNDLWLDLRGGIYFSDPRYGGNKGDRELSGEQVYYISPNRKDIIQVTDDLVRPNGLIGTRDGRYLYISDHGDKKTWKYSIRKDGSLRNKTLFIEEGSDGVTLDIAGNLYLTGGAVRIFNSNGTFLEEIETPKAPSNVAFGGKDKDILFITARDCVYFIKTKVKGASVN